MRGVPEQGLLLRQCDVRAKWKSHVSCRPAGLSHGGLAGCNGGYVLFARPIPVLGHLTKERRFRNSAQFAPSGERNALDFYTDDLAVFDTTLRWFLGFFQLPTLKFTSSTFWTVNVLRRTLSRAIVVGGG